jgi:flagellar biosynthesis/type III secretory pathway protein FliH
MKRTFYTICIALVLAMLAMGCAKPPTAEMTNATEAVTRAENDSNAVTYAWGSVARAKDALTRMNAEATAKRYDSARAYAAEAIAAADRAINDGRAGAERARNEAANHIADLKPLLAETEQGINAARKARLPIDFESVDKDFDEARANTAQAEAAYAGNRYGDAIDRGRAARVGLNSINQRLSTSTLAVTRRK